MLGEGRCGDVSTPQRQTQEGGPEIGLYLIVIVSVCISFATNIFN